VSAQGLLLVITVGQGVLLANNMDDLKDEGMYNHMWEE
jgi:hypothetical protein